MLVERFWEKKKFLSYCAELPEAEDLQLRRRVMTDTT